MVVFLLRTDDQLDTESLGKCCGVAVVVFFVSLANQSLEWDGLDGLLLLINH